MFVVRSIVANKVLLQNKIGHIFRSLKKVFWTDSQNWKKIFSRNFMSTSKSSLLSKEEKIKVIQELKERFFSLKNDKPPSSYDIPSSYRGPIRVSNWLIPNILLVGGFPGHKEEEQHNQVIQDLADSGINVIVTLMTEKELKRFRSNTEQLSKAIPDLESIHFPIPDQSTASDEAVEKFIPSLIEKITESKKKVYVHCWGGHGRTGTIVSLALSHLLEIEASPAIQFVQETHKTREHNPYHASPETQSQFQQVKKLAWKK